jgi:hypothetical protein
LAAFVAQETTSACAKDYKEFWQNFDQSGFAKMAADRIADLSRKAIRAYEACEAGDEQGAKRSTRDWQARMRR